MTFYLGTNSPTWFYRTGVPLFFSAARLRAQKKPGRIVRKATYRAIGPWALDSGGFSELQYKGCWTIEPAQFVDEARHWFGEFGPADFVCIQDWMCEPAVIQGGAIGHLQFVGTGLSVAEHQRRTVENYLNLRDLAPEIPWLPVLQGWERSEYFDCLRLYESAGVDLRTFPRVGLGSVCRRQATLEIRDLVGELAGAGLALHGFGVKTQAFYSPVVTHGLVSADSMAWSKQAMKRPPLPSCVGEHKTCSSCLSYALQWAGGSSVADCAVGGTALPARARTRRVTPSYAPSVRFLVVAGASVEDG